MAAVSRSQLRAWQDSNLVDCLGHVEDIPKLWANTHIAVLPSYREGLPKTLIEAAACARPIVTTDTSGCREVVEHGFNGYLVPVKNIPLLADALEKLIVDRELRMTMGCRNREKVLREFSNRIVINETIDIYNMLHQSS